LNRFQVGRDSDAVGVAVIAANLDNENWLRMGLQAFGDTAMLAGLAAVVRPLGGATSAPNGLPGVPGRVQSRINLANEGMEHVIRRHLSGNKNASQFSLAEADLRKVLGSSQEVNSPVVRTLESADGIRYVREFDAGRVIGTDRFQGNQATPLITIIADRFGNLVSAFPGLLK
jgi:hypothetical protein